MRSAAEDFQDQPGAVEHLGVPRLLQVALLHRRERAIGNHDAGFEAFDEAGDLVDLAGAHVGRGPNLADRHDPGLHDVEIDGAGKPDGLLQARGRGALVLRRACSDLPRRDAPLVGTDDDRAAAARARGAQAVRIRVATSRLQLDFLSGRRLFATFEQLDRMTRHDRRDGVLVDQLRVAVPPQQHAEIIEPGHDALQFYAIDQENGQRALCFCERD